MAAVEARADCRAAAAARGRGDAPRDDADESDDEQRRRDGAADQQAPRALLLLLLLLLRAAGRDRRGAGAAAAAKRGCGRAPTPRVGARCLRVSIGLVQQLLLGGQRPLSSSARHGAGVRALKPKMAHSPLSVRALLKPSAANSRKHLQIVA